MVSWQRGRYFGKLNGPRKFKIESLINHWPLQPWLPWSYWNRQISDTASWKQTLINRGAFCKLAAERNWLVKVNPFSVVDLHAVTLRAPASNCPPASFPPC